MQQYRQHDQRTSHVSVSAEHPILEERDGTRFQCLPSDDFRVIIGGLEALGLDLSFRFFFTNLFVRTAHCAFTNLNRPFKVINSAKLPENSHSPFDDLDSHNRPVGFTPLTDAVAAYTLGYGPPCLTSHRLMPDCPQIPTRKRRFFGAILLDNVQPTPEAAERLEPDDFSLDSHQRIFLRMTDLMNAQRAVDIVTLSHELAARSRRSKL